MNAKTRTATQGETVEATAVADHTFAELVEMMVDSDLQQQRRERYLKEGGYEVNSTFE